jgi:hypothetical protein
VLGIYENPEMGRFHVRIYHFAKAGVEPQQFWSLWNLHPVKILNSVNVLFLTSAARDCPDPTYSPTELSDSEAPTFLLSDAPELDPLCRLTTG